MDLAALEALLADPAPVTYALERLDARDEPLAALTEVRGRFPHLSPAASSAALTHAQLRRRARVRFGELAEHMWFTADGVEQATHPIVAVHRARRFAALAAALGRPASVADLCCGIGSDLHALRDAGCAVTGYDADPLAAAVARANWGDPIECLDVATLGRRKLSGFDAAFLDPSRRSGGSRTFDVSAYSPPWPYATALLATLPAAVKVAPGIPHELVPSGVETEWVSLRGKLKEAVLWSRDFATPGTTRRATALPAGASLTTGGDGPGPAPVVPVRRYLYEPDSAVIRAHLVAEVARQVGGGLLDATTAYITSDRHVATPFARTFEVDAAMPFSLKALRAELRARDVGSVTIMKRGSAVDVERLRRELRLRGQGHVVVVLALMAGRHSMLLVEHRAGAPCPADTGEESGS